MEMRPKYTYAIRPRLPENLQFLKELAYNLWWDWNYDAVDLFRRVSRRLWDEGQQNPVYLLLRAEQERINYMAREEGFLNHMERVRTMFGQYMTEPRWFQKTYPERQDILVGYFSAEFGLSSCLPVYSGGLGILAGDHLKTASDIGLPLVAVGLAYRQGYFHQYLNIDGWQQERYDENEFHVMPIEEVRDEQGNWLTIDIPYLGRPVKAAVLKVNVGRVPLYLLTTNLPANRPDDRIITDQLYGGDREMRIRQEIVLGIGGVITLRTLGYRPTVYHMNEGHSAFLSLERMKSLMESHALDYPSAFEAACASMCFTTHTAVPAGHDMFTEDLVRKYLEPLSVDLGLGWERFAAIARDPSTADTKVYSMPVMALHNSAYNNGVSRLHAHVARGMWQQIWPQLPRDEVPIAPVTNGVHVYSWVSHDMAALFERYIGPDWRLNPLEPELWHRIYEVPDEEIWRTHESRRARLVAYARRLLEKQMAARGASREEIAAASEVLNPEALTIGFARRFATYKRAALLFRDIERLKRLVGDRERPVQFIFAGKAHPRDDEGKKLIRQIVHTVRDETLRYRFVFLEDYDIAMARYMVQGADVWLNTPRRPLEASGTSGMKAVANGAIHLSTVDGWWDQAYHQDIGWAIGSGEEYEDTNYQDEVEGDALYDLLEREVVPLYYERTLADLPREWVHRMKRSMASLIPRFCSHRMLRNYIDEAYLPAHLSHKQLWERDFAQAKALAGWRAQIEQHWPEVKVVGIEVDKQGDLLVGDALSIRAAINPGALSAEDVRVEVYSGVVDTKGNFQGAKGLQMQLDMASDPRQPRFTATLSAPQSGFFGFTIRLFPDHDNLPHKYATYRITWAS
jgi:starch phosphorylase